MTMRLPSPRRVRNIFICIGGRVLRLVQHDKGIRQRAPAHEGQGRDLDPLFLHQLLHLLGGRKSFSASYSGCM